MADTLTQAEADALLAMEKRAEDKQPHPYPMPDGKVSIPLLSPDRREKFVLDINRGRIDVRKVTHQNRARQTVVIARLDISGPPHRNPDDEEIPTPHLHLYREGFGDKWAFPVPIDQFPRLDDPMGTLEDFMRYCNITVPPNIVPVLI